MRLGLFTSVVLLIFAASPVVFRGCGDDTPPDLPLPPADAGVCLVDTDCPTFSACADVRCLAGACVLVAPSVDHDRDGAPPIPCGTDCDDGNRLVHPGADELCNGRDDDCDGAVDEGAPPTVTNRVVGSLDGPASLTRLGDGLIIAVGNDARAVDGYGRVGELFDVLGDRAIAQTETATGPDGRAVVASILEGRAGIAFALLSPGAPPTISPPVDLVLPGPVLDLAIAAHADSFAMAWTWQDALGAFQLAVMPDITATTPPLIFGADSASVSLASDGSALAFPGGAGLLGFVTAAGARSTLLLDGMLLRHGLTSDAGSVVALVLLAEGSTEAHATRVDRSAGPTALGPVLSTPDGLFASDETRLAPADGRYIATRAGFADLRITVFDGTGTTTPLAFVLPRGTLTPVSIADVPGLVGVLGATPTSALSAGSDLALITACGSI